MNRKRQTRPNFIEHGDLDIIHIPETGVPKIVSIHVKPRSNAGAAIRECVLKNECTSMFDYLTIAPGLSMAVLEDQEGKLPVNAFLKSQGMDIRGQVFIIKSDEHKDGYYDLSQSDIDALPGTLAEDREKRQELISFFEGNGYVVIAP